MGRSLYTCAWPGCQSRPSKKHNVQRHIFLKHLRSKLPSNHLRADHIVKPMIDRWLAAYDASEEPNAVAVATAKTEPTETVASASDDGTLSDSSSNGGSTQSGGAVPQLEDTDSGSIRMAVAALLSLPTPPMRSSSSRGPARAAAASPYGMGWMSPSSPSVPARTSSLASLSSASTVYADHDSRDNAFGHNKGSAEVPASSCSTPTSLHLSPGPGAFSAVPVHGTTTHSDSDASPGASPMLASFKRGITTVAVPRHLRTERHSHGPKPLWRPWDDEEYESRAFHEVCSLLTRGLR